MLSNIHRVVQPELLLNPRTCSQVATSCHSLTALLPAIFISLSLPTLHSSLKGSSQDLLVGTIAFQLVPSSWLTW